MSTHQIQICHKILRNWKQSDKISFRDTITTLTDLKDYTSALLTETLQLVTKTVKDISSNKQERHDGYMEEILKLKKSLKDKETVFKKKEGSMKKEEKATEKTPQIVVPPTLGSDLSEQRRKIASYLYTCFLQNFNQKYTQPILQKFILSLQSQLNTTYNGDPEKIGSHLPKMKVNIISPKSSFAKIEMLNGIITPKEVVANKSSTYEDKSDIAEKLQALGKAGQMKEEKLEGMGEECDKCRAMEAYCWKMQQIRASDEPMTRFMRCRACKETWTD